jgi:hypothetical protein
VDILKHQKSVLLISILHLFNQMIPESDSTSSKILDFWFSPESKQYWFAKKKKFDHLRGKPRRLGRGQERGLRSRPCFAVNAAFVVVRYIGE